MTYILWKRFNMTGNDKLRKENQALCNEIEELWTNNRKCWVNRWTSLFHLFWVAICKLCICLILDTWLRGVQISQDPIAHKYGNSSCKHPQWAITQTIEIMPQEPKNIIIIRAATLAGTSLHLRSLGKLKSQHLYREWSWENYCKHGVRTVTEHCRVCSPCKVLPCTIQAKETALCQGCYWLSNLLFSYVSHLAELVIHHDKHA